MQSFMSVAVPSSLVRTASKISVGAAQLRVSVAKVYISD